VTCTECREALSARLDGEDDAGEATAVDTHLTGCGDCRRWADRAAAVTRLARTASVAPFPDLVATVMAAAPIPRRVHVHVRTPLRVVLACAGFGQLWLAVSGILLASARGAHGGAELGGANLEHLTHESAAWNLALAVGFLWVAARHRRAGALVPLVGAFVAMLAALSLPDLLSGEVELSREASHVVALLGLLALMALGRFGGRPHEGTPVVPRPAEDPGEVADEFGRAPAVRRAGPDQDLKPTGEHRAA
jgi:predicted anti-sigma-YlaC factor YlaD